MSDGSPAESRVQGHALAAIDAIPAAVAGALARLWILSAEQLVAAASVPGGRDGLRSYLGLDDEALEVVLAAAGSAMPPARAMLVAAPEPPDRGLGAFPPTDEIIAETEALPLSRLAATEAAALPAAVDLSRQMPAVRNQGGRGTCVAFALTAVHEFHRRVQGGQPELSEQHLYYETKQIDGQPNGCGTWIVRAAQALGANGECRETVWPYNPSSSCNEHGTLPAGARPDGATRKLEARRLDPRNIAGIKAALAGGSPVAFSIPVYDSWYRSAETRRTGRITLRIGNEAATGGHAMCLIGYQDDGTAPGGGYFVLRNSWGSGWASESTYGAGNGTIPYAYLANDNWEAFTADPVAPDEDETLVRITHDFRPEFIGWNGDCYVRIASFVISNAEAQRAIALERVRLRSWDGEQAVDELVVQAGPAGSGGVRELRIEGGRLRGVGARFGWRYRITWDFSYRELSGALGEPQELAPEGAAGEAVGSSGDAGGPEGAVGGRRTGGTLTIETSGDVRLVVR